MKKERYDFNDLKKIVTILTGENGCPWDRVQTHESLKVHLIEECYEVIDAINNKDDSNLCEELGDILFHVVFHCVIAEKEDSFTLDDVIDSISKKMINRHKHIFSNGIVNKCCDTEKNWDEIKKTEKGYKSQTEALKSVSKTLPALIRTEKVQKKASNLGFDLENLDNAMQSLYSEIHELEEVMHKTDDEKYEEFGDILFACVNLSRFLKINPEFSLTNSLEKFINRFEHIENTLISKGLSFGDISIDDMNVLWNESKRALENKVYLPNNLEEDI